MKVYKGATVEKFSFIFSGNKSIITQEASVKKLFYPLAARGCLYKEQAIQGD
jgi:hypothetical protein